jgi:hypothetical protein
VGGKQDRGPGLAPIGFQPGADPVGGVGIERGGRLIEQKQFRAIDQGFGQGHAGLLAGGQLAARAIEKIAEIELGGEFCDPRLEIGNSVKPAEHGEVLPHREPHRHVDIGALEIHPPEHPIALLGHRAAEHPDTT